MLVVVQHSIYACFVLILTIVFMGKLTVAWYICAQYYSKDNVPQNHAMELNVQCCELFYKTCFISCHYS